MKPGELYFGIGRHNKYNDDKGLPDGVNDDSHIFLTLTFGLFPISDVKS